jgi:fermentation-respiration switch protein FrsA (DUF1100 family)
VFFTDSYQALRRGERARAARYALISVLTLLLIGVPVGFIMLRRFEKAVTFHPNREPLRGSWAVPRGGEDVWFETSDGLRLHGWFFRARTQPPAATVIYFHGNAGNLSYADWVGVEFATRGFDVLLFDYRGYGRSEGELSDENGLYNDSDAAYDFLVRERHVKPERIVLYGESLGTAAAVDVASRKPCGAIILESGLSSARDMAGAILPWMPRFLRGITRNKFDSVGKLSLVRTPALVVHGEKDDLIPVAQGHALYEAANEPKELMIIRGAGHNNLAIIGGNGYLDSVAQFINNALAKDLP